MDVLIDTQILIWTQENNPALLQPARKVLSDPDNRIFATQISLFEIAIKLKIGKLPDFKVSVDAVTKQVKQDGIRIVQLAERHINSYDHIPFYDDHRDSFDRLILATALAEDMAVISSDEKFRRYQGVVTVIW